PGPGADDVRLRRLGPGPVRLAPGPDGDRRVRLPADARPDEPRLAEPIRDCAGDQVDELASTQLLELGRAGRDGGQIALGAAGQQSAVEDPVRRAAEERDE